MSKARRLNNRGQTLVIAILVMFLLALIATVFIALVARNLFRSERVSNTDSVAQIAEAGIRYADKMLVSSEDGADWRPEPDNLGILNPRNPSFPPVYDPGWQNLRDNNPDFKWTHAYWPTELFPPGYPSAPGEIGYAGPTGGFTTVNTGQGRFLLRVSYNPNTKDPLSKYIKIESIGRWGVILSGDPTTWTSAGHFNNMRRELTAYKPIGITDYLRFVTNKNKRSMDLPLGCPGFKIDMGRANNTRYGFRGGPIRVNGNLLWYGNASKGDAVDLYLRGIKDSNGQILPIDRVEVAGDINVVDPKTSVAVHELAPDGSDLSGMGAAIPLPPSNDANYTTASGFYRDGRDTTDANNMARGVKRIEPPLVDQPDPTNTSTRYRLLSLNSGERYQLPSGRWFLRGRYGWGRGVYIGNTRDTQDDDDTLIGAYTVRYDLLNPNNPMKNFWNGPCYVPPGAVIVLHPRDTDGDGQPDFTITRTDSLPTNQRAMWYDPWGNPRPEWGNTITMPYPDAKRGRILDGSLFGTQAHAQDKIELTGNGVIYAEGNIRMRGMLPPDTQLTVVSNENIYIEGNILKYRKPGVEKDPKFGNDPWRGADETCGLSLLARKNVVVNTTQFFWPLSDNWSSDAKNGTPPHHLTVTTTPGSEARFETEFGPYESESGNTPTSLNMLLRHSGEYGSAYIYAALNRNNTSSRGILTLPHAVFPGLPDFVYGVGDPHYTAPGWGVDTAFACDVFSLSSANAWFTDWTNWSNSPVIGLPNIFELALYPSRAYRNYLLGGFALQPMDVRIEAVIYAQEGSFYVVPGRWFNPNPTDLPGSSRPAGIDPYFPYYGQPLDIRVVIDGAISENLPAAVSDVEDWMSKWGRIPDNYGSTMQKTAHPGEGLTILYDDHAGWPLSNIRGTSPAPIRMDKYHRVLPITPRLPVSGSLIYFGDIT